MPPSVFTHKSKTQNGGISGEWLRPLTFFRDAYIFTANKPFRESAKALAFPPPPPTISLINSLLEDVNKGHMTRSKLLAKLSY